MPGRGGVVRDEGVGGSGTVSGEAKGSSSLSSPFCLVTLQFSRSLVLDEDVCYGSLMASSGTYYYGALFCF